MVRKAATRLLPLRLPPSGDASPLELTTAEERRLVEALAALLIAGATTDNRADDGGPDASGEQR